MLNAILDIPLLHGCNAFINTFVHIRGIIPVNHTFISPQRIIDKVIGRIAGERIDSLAYEEHRPVFVGCTTVDNTRDVGYKSAILLFAPEQSFPGSPGQFDIFHRSGFVFRTVDIL